MLNTEMLARVRELVDESADGFWTSANHYINLSEAQRQLVNIMLKTYLAKREVDPAYPVPDLLRVLRVTVFDYSFGTTGTSTVALPADFLLDIHVEYDDNGSAVTPAFRISENQNRQFGQYNTYLKSNQNQFVYWIDGTNLNFGTAVSGTGAYSLTYLKKPTEIDGSTQPIFPSYTHEALCQYAAAEAFKKDENVNQYNICIQQFMNLIQNYF